MNTSVSKSGNELIGLVALMRIAMSGEDLGPLGMRLIQKAGDDPRLASPNVLMDLSTVLQLRGQRDLALQMQSYALAMQRVYGLPNAAARVKLLVVMGAGDLMSNSPIEFLLEGESVALDLLYVLPGEGMPDVVPEHDVLFVAVAESEQNIPVLHNLQAALDAWPRPVLNRPQLIAALSRDSNYARLKSEPGVAIPYTLRLSRDLIKEGATDFPLIVRPVDSHAGQGLEKIADAAALVDYLARMSEDEFYVSPFVDYRSADGQFRKYRIVLIEGRPFICHMGISDHWMIHYMNAGMAENAEKRDEEAAFMRDFDGGFALKHAPAFARINALFGLDYLGIDCAETIDGELLIFEVDSCMIVHALDPVDLFAYKQPQMKKVFDAFFGMLARAASRVQA